MPLKIEIGDILTLKKKHPCGSVTWEVLRVGADFKIKCTGCGHLVMVARSKLEGSICSSRTVKEEDKSAKSIGEGGD